MEIERQVNDSRHIIQGEGFGRDSAQFLSVRGWLGFAETLIPITLIITLVALPTSLWKRRQHTQRQGDIVAPA